MSRVRLQGASGIVLRRYNLGESDRILVVYTRERGKVRVIAKGVRRTASKLAGHLETFSHVKLLLAQGRELDVVSQAQIQEPFAKLRDDLNRTAQAYVISEIVDLGTPDEHAQADLFDALLSGLRAIAEQPRADLASLHAQLYLLAQLGFRPELQRCVRCRNPLEAVVNSMNPERGGAVCPDCTSMEPGSHRIEVDVLKLLRVLQRAGAPGSVTLNVTPRLVQAATVEVRRLSERSLDRSFRAPPFVVRAREVTDVDYGVPSPGRSESPATVES
jgi:DNA repair protein RecO (recombination protein O)